MRINVPPKRVREKFLITYELYGAQKGVNCLTEYYHIRKMRIVLDGKRTGRTCVAFYENGKATFRKSSLNRTNVLHEFYHHLTAKKHLELSESIEEKEANSYARKFLLSHYF